MIQGTLKSSNFTETVGRQYITERGFHENYTIPIKTENSVGSQNRNRVIKAYIASLFES